MGVFLWFVLAAACFLSGKAGLKANTNVYRDLPNET
jgi:hypothetical protein